MRTLTVLAVVAMLVAGCGRTALQPVTPAPALTTIKFRVVAREARPNLMLLIDRSSSMLTNTSTQPPCPAAIGGCGPGAPCPEGCATRLSELKTALNDFLAVHGKDLRVGVSIFPQDAACAATGESEVLLHLPAASVSDEELALQAQADQAIGVIGSLTAMGETPTAGSLRFLGTLGELTDVDHPEFVLLVTDGAPDCNPDNAFNCTDAVACQCTVSACTPQNGLCSLGCLDADPAVAAVKALRDANVSTAIIALGPDAASPGASDTFNRMATVGVVGPFEAFRTCPSFTDAECGAGDSCIDGTCQRQFWRAADASELSAALASLVTPLPEVGGECDYKLASPPADPATLSVFVNGAEQIGCGAAAGCETWTYAQGTLTFHGVTCELLKSSTPQTPVELKVQFP